MNGRRSGRHISLAWSLLCVLLPLGQYSNAYTLDDDLTHQFLSEYLPNLNKYEMYYSSGFEAKGAFEVNYTPKNQKPHGWNCLLQFECFAERVRITKWEHEEVKKVTVNGEVSLVSSPELSFCVSRPEGGTFAVKYMDRQLKDPAYKLMILRLAAPFMTPLHLGRLRMRDLVTAPSFKVVGLNSVGDVRHEEQLLRVEFEVGPDSGNRFLLVVTPKFAQTAVRGWFTVDPKNNWVIREFEYAHADEPAAVDNGIVQYASSPGSLPLVKEATLVSRWANGTEVREHARVEGHKQGKIPLTRFALEDFGISSTEGAQHGMSLIVWFLVVATACLALGLFLKWISERLHQTES